ncbi:hypothetical protein [Oceanicoccus sp. KOV_DT_Chl]|uniref:hypothetical protein n=1 Tax=Oceanicoccus sp. KOV_DT_Chl TaxID=1904639 RepID=UPI000C7C66EC|nr:hypothetical protein [Oceanicoccus sp. KOV_DT_Chl]
MSSNDPVFPSRKSPKEALLDELQSIKGLLDDDPKASDLPLDIPTLDDVVDGQPAAQPVAADDKPSDRLLDLNSIFDNDDELATSADIGDFDEDIATDTVADSEEVNDDVTDQAPDLSLPRFYRHWLPELLSLH